MEKISKFFFIFFIGALMSYPQIIHAQLFNQDWQKYVNTPNIDYKFSATKLCSDYHGSMWMISQKDTCGTTEIYIQKYDIAGNLLLSTDYFISQDVVSWIRDVICDVNGNLYIGSARISSTTKVDFDVTKYDINGNFIWTYTFDGLMHDNDYVVDMKVDSNENLVVCGTTLADTLAPTEYYQIAGIDSSGMVLFEKQLYAVGSYAFIHLNMNNGSFSLITINQYGAIFLEGYDLSGSLIYHTDVDPNYDLSFSGNFVSDDFGNSYLTGYSNSLHDYIISKYDLNGNWIWEKIFGQDSRFMKVEGNSIYLARSVSSALLISKLDTAGYIQWSVTHNGTPGSTISISDIVEIYGRTFIVGNEYLSATHYEEFILEYDQSASVVHYSYGQIFHEPIACADDASGKLFVATPTMQLFSCDTSMQNTFLKHNHNFQDGDDRSQLMMKDIQGNIIFTGFIKLGADTIGVGVYKYNSTGNELWRANVPFPDHSWIYVTNMFCDANSNCFISGLASQNYTGNNFWEPFVLMISAAGQVAWHYVHQNVSTSFVEKVSLYADNNNSIYFSCAERGNNFHHPYLVKLNYLGDSLWTKYLTGINLDYETNSGIVYSNDSLFEMLAGKNEFTLLTMDTAGIVLSSVQIPSAYTQANSYPELYLDPSGDIVALSVRFDTVCNLYCYWRWYVTKINKQGDQQWEWLYNSSNPLWDRISSVKFDSVSNIYLAGSINVGNVTSALNPNIMICKLSSTGNILWADSSFESQGTCSMDIGNNFVYSLAGNSVEEWIRVYDSTGTLIYTDSLPLTLLNRAIIGDSPSFYTLTNNKNYCTGNDINITKYNYSPLNVTETSARHDILYPNPVHTMLYIKNNIVDADNYCIYNMLGEKVLQGKMHNKSIDVYSLPRGVYTISFSGLSLRRKFVKE